MSFVIDCTQSPSVDSMKAAGVSGVCRYLSWLFRWGGTTHSYVNPKVIQKPEFDSLINGDLGVLLNWEYDEHDWLGGSDAGKAHATEAVRQAKLLGLPPGMGCAIPGSCDFDITLGQWKASGQHYAREYSAVMRGEGFLPGPYGPYDLLTWVRDAGYGDMYWQAGMSTSWSGGRNANLWPGAHLRQRRHVTIGGLDCDYNDIIQTNYGQYGKGFDVATLDEILTKLSWVDPRVEGMAKLIQPTTGSE